MDSKANSLSSIYHITLMHYPHTHYTPSFFSYTTKMVSLDTPQANSKSKSKSKSKSVPVVVEPNSSPRISFSSDFLDENDYISISPNPRAEKESEKKDKEKASSRNVTDFDFLSNNLPTQNPMMSADELMFEGKLLPFWQQHYAEKLNKISLKPDDDKKVDQQGGRKVEEVVHKEESRPMNWFIDEDPSPRPPKCIVLWKELLRLKKQRASSLSPSSSTSSSSSSLDLPPINEGCEHKEKVMKRIKKGLERTRSASLRIRPVVNVPVCTQMRSSALPPLFRKVRLDR